MVFNILLPPPPPMDVEQATSSSASLPPTATSLLPMAPMSVQPPITAQPPLVTATCPIFGAAPPAGTLLHFEP
uniref:Uncharacterized protein n=1 Tax=Romanomermis culicivorax TaxID=13658 RepID=A0A915I7H2_ROMCU